MPECSGRKACVSAKLSAEVRLVSEHQITGDVGKLCVRCWEDMHSAIKPLDGEQLLW